MPAQVQKHVRHSAWSTDNSVDDDGRRTQLHVQLNGLVSSETMYIRTLGLLRDVFWLQIDKDQASSTSSHICRRVHRMLGAFTSIMGSHRRFRNCTSSDVVEPHADAYSDNCAGSTSAESVASSKCSTPTSRRKLSAGSIGLRADDASDDWHKSDWCICGRRSMAERARQVVELLFSNLIPQMEMHTQFLLKIQQLQPLSEHVDEFLPVMLEHVQACTSYEHYLRHHTHALVEFENLLLHDAHLAKAVARCEEETGVNLRALLVKPLERTRHYDNLIQALHVEYLPESMQDSRTLETCAVRSAELSRRLKPMLRHISDLRDLAILQRRIVDLPTPFLHVDQRLLYSTPVQLLRSNRFGWHNGQFWLLADRIIIAREKRDGERYAYETCVPLERCTFCPGSDRRDQYSAVFYAGDSLSLVRIRLDSAHEFAAWRRALEEAIAGTRTCHLDYELQ
ncbi:hypothetical protein THASP1DRAFT_26789 [Thamnocephalis sphaerospora]|uniref:DH domain-containing protein n=1 Tax=Thamnocephalis sphaerospora TaxID=78915 RepID=A0A4P9XG87_9FUNG|nr:hypothetical protein THASP1DRAFT_26789 [Thamnocephalis sphaerospora]|eukprot:RKP04617.1 hypothetical protein THASP1DRAFT_26789 [Thamnocephalis sphaerospora]